MGAGGHAVANVLKNINVFEFNIKMFFKKLLKLL